MVLKILQQLVLHNCAPCRRKFSQLAIGSSLRKLDETTLTGRILLYFNPIPITDHTKKLKSEEVQILHQIKSDSNYNLENKSMEELRKLFLLSNGRDCVKNKFEFFKILDTLDTECYLRMGRLETKDIFDILRIYIHIAPTKLTQFKFYQAAIDKLSGQVDTLGKHELLQFMFFVGLQKKNKNSQKILRRCMQRVNAEFVETLTTEELCIICDATFKTATRICNRKFLDRVKDFINDNLCILKDPAMFITFVKTIRQNQCQDDNLLSTISCALFFNKTLQYYVFGGMCHILALYADYMYYDENVLKHFSIKCIEMLRNSVFSHRMDYFTKYVRDKDLKRFLWCLSRLGYDLDENIIRNEIIPNIVERIQKGDLRKDPHLTVEIILYLWVMNYQAVELFPYVLTKENIELIYESNLTKRLNLLLTAIYFENRPVFRDYDLKVKGAPNFNREQQVHNRPHLKRVMDNLKVILPKTELNKFEFTSQIPYLDIVGIVGFKKNIYKSVYIEVLDESNCLKNTDFLPSGIMKMKLRILNGFEEGLVVVSCSVVLAFLFQICVFR